MSGIDAVFLLSSSPSSLTPSAAASAASVAAPDPATGLESVQGTRPDSEEAQGGHSIGSSSVFFFSIFLVSIFHL